MDRIFDILTRNHPDPQTFEEFDRLATIAYARGEYEETITYIDKCIDLAAGNAVTLGALWTQKGVVYKKMGDAQTALTALDTAAEYTPNNPQMLLLRSQLLMDAGEYGQASKSLLLYTELLPEDTEGWELLAQAHRSMKENTKADEAQAEADRHTDNPQSALLTSARAAALTGDLQSAEEGFSAYLQDNDDEGGDIHFARGAVRMRGGAIAEAAFDLETALALSYKEPAVAYEYLSSCYFQLGEYAKVLEAGKRCAELGNEKPAYDTMYQRMGLAALALEDFATAETHFTSAIAANEALAGSLYYRSLARMGQSRYSDALEDLTTSIERDELTQRCLYNRGMCYIQENEINRAIDDLEAAISTGGEAEVTQAAEDILWQLALQYMTETE